MSKRMSHHPDEFPAALDPLLREWHEENSDRTGLIRERILRAARVQEKSRGAMDARSVVVSCPETPAGFRIGPVIPWRIAAAIAVLAGLAVILLPQQAHEARADMLMLPDGGRLEAFDQHGNVIGPCALSHTDVEIDVSGLFARTTVRQQYRNPYGAKIEAVYTFPLPHEAAVDRMRMVINEDRVVEGEVRERQEARQIYESARDAGHVAALLEQERPNIFTQSVANIEPDAEIAIEISYIEMVTQRDGEFILAFPMTVAPRYVPGYPLGGAGLRPAPARLPDGLTFRRGVILQGPATFERITLNLLMPAGEFGIQGEQLGAMTTSLGLCPQLETLLERAIPITDAGINEWRALPEQQARFLRLPDFAFEAIYSDGSREIGQLSGEGLGHISGRWFWFEPEILRELGLIDDSEPSPSGRGQGEGELKERAHLPRPLTPSPSPEGRGELGLEPFAADTDQVPDASRITPMPVHPSTRAGHDISVRVTIDTGGPALTSVESELHEINLKRGEADSCATIELLNGNEIPNRDFVLKWTLDDFTIQESTFVHAGDDFEQNGGYFTLILAPPARVAPGSIVPRELIFVLDTSGSMSGEPIAKAKSVLTSAIDAMREGDTFNIITFAGHTDILWDAPRPNTNANRAEALAWINSQEGQGGTEMMAAIEAALNPLASVGQVSRPSSLLSLEELSNLPADGREVEVRFPREAIQPGEWWSKSAWGTLGVREDLVIDWTAPSWEIVPLMVDESIQELTARGTWSTRDGRRYFDMHSVESVTRQPSVFGDGAPMRLSIFLTDGEVGNDMAIIDAVKRYAATTRVFAFGVGNSVNRYLLANMAYAGRGEVEFVTQETQRKDAVERFVKRIESPVLTDIELEFSEGLEVSDMLPLTPGGFIPDLYDVQPLIIHGRYAQAGKGTLTVRGRTGGEAYERTIEVDFPARSEDHDVIRTLWARRKVDELTNADLTGVQVGAIPSEQRRAIVDLAVRHQIMSQFTSFVAVEKSRVTVDGRPTLVRVPIELPSDARWEGYFGSDGCIDMAKVEEAIEEIVTHDKMVAAARAKEAEAIRAKYGSLDDADREEVIHELLLKVRDDQLERKYDEALDTVDQILLLDEGNPAAIAMRDAVETAALWQSHLVTEAAKEQSYAWQMQDNRETRRADLLEFTGAAGGGEQSSGGAAAFSGQIVLPPPGTPRPNSGPDVRSTTGLTQHPKDWPTLDLRYSDSIDTANAVNSQFHLGASFADDGRLNDSLDFGLAVGSDSSAFESLRTSINMNAASPETLRAIEAIQMRYPPQDLTTKPSLRSVQESAGQLVEIPSDERDVIRSQLETDAFAGTVLAQNPALDIAAMRHGQEFMIFLTWLDGLEQQSSGATTFFLPPTMAPFMLLGVAEDQINEVPQSDLHELSPEEAVVALLAQRVCEIADQLAAATAEGTEHASPRAAAAALALVFDPKDPAHHPFYIERCAIAVTDLVSAGHADEARTLAQWIVAGVEAPSEGAIPGGLQELMDSLRAFEAALDPVAKNLKPPRSDEELGEAIRVAAEESMTAQVQAAIVTDTLRARLDDEFFARWLADRDTAREAPGGDDDAETILVTILVSEAPDNSLVEQLEMAGVVVESSAPRTRIVIGRIAPAPRILERIALLPVVRRVERAELE